MRRSLTMWLVAVAASAAADELRVELQNGRRLAAVAATDLGNRWQFELASGGVLELGRSEVESVVTITPEAPAAQPPSDPAVPLPEHRPDPKLALATPFDDWIVGLSARHGVDPWLVRAVVLAESRFDDDALSRAGALGLMQLMPATARELGCANRLDPVANLDCGIRYLKQMLDEQSGDLGRALAAYNAGPEAVRRHGGVPPFPETRAYVARILGWLGRGAESPR